MAESINPVTESQLGIPPDERKGPPPVVSVPKLDEDGIYRAGAQVQVVEDMAKSAIAAKDDASHADGAASFDVAAIQNWLPSFWPSLMATTDGERKAIAEMGLGGSALYWLNSKVRVTTTGNTSSAGKMLAKRTDRRLERRATIRKALKKEMLQKEVTQVDPKATPQRVYWKPKRLSFKAGDVVPFIPFRGQTDRDAVVDAVRAA